MSFVLVEEKKRKKKRQTISVYRVCVSWLRMSVDIHLAEAVSLLLMVNQLAYFKRGEKNDHYEIGWYSLVSNDIKIKIKINRQFYDPQKIII